MLAKWGLIGIDLQKKILKLQKIGWLWQMRGVRLNFFHDKPLLKISTNFQAMRGCTSQGSWEEEIQEYFVSDIVMAKTLDAWLQRIMNLTYSFIPEILTEPPLWANPVVDSGQYIREEDIGSRELMVIENVGTGKGRRQWILRLKSFWTTGMEICITGKYNRDGLEGKICIFERGWG